MEGVDQRNARHRVKIFPSFLLNYGRVAGKWEPCRNIDGILKCDYEQISTTLGSADRRSRTSQPERKSCNAKSMSYWDIIET
jgi:hypothetical protein